MRTTWHSSIILLVIVASIASGAWGQTQSGRQRQETTAADQLRIKLMALAKELEEAKTSQERINAFEVNKQIEIFTLAVALRNSPSVFALVSAAEEARIDKQVGGTDANSGSTSLVSKGSVPSILGFAVENGALTRTQSGTTITFRGNPAGMVNALRKVGFLDSYRDAAPETRFLRRLSFALSFDANRGSMVGTFTGDLQQLSSYSVRFDILNHRDPRDKIYAPQWHHLIEGDVSVYAARVRDLGNSLAKDQKFLDWHRNAQDALVQAKSEDVESILQREFEKLKSLQVSPDLQSLIDAYAKTYSDYLQNRDKILETVSRGTIVTFEHGGIRQVKAPDLSNFKLIVERSLYQGKAEATTNVSLTILNTIPTGTNASRVNDIQFSTQLDVPLGQIQKTGSFLFSISAMYKRMRNEAFTSTGTTMMNTKGDLAIGQFKLTVPVKGSGIKIPISLTVANRTELIKESDVRGNIGMTFDLDSLFSRLKP